MRIAHVAPLYERVPPRLYGGTERVVSHLVEEQVARGHEVTLFASGDSRTSASIVSAVPRALRLDVTASDQLAPHMIELSQVFDRAADFDVIHCHVDSTRSWWCEASRAARRPRRNTASDEGGGDDGRGSDQEQPVVVPQVMHLRQVPLRTMVNWPHSPHGSPS